MSSRRWAWIVLLAALWAAYLCYVSFASTGHADTLPAEIEGGFRMALIVGTIADAAVFYLGRRNDASNAQTAAELRWCILGLREEVRRIGSYRVIGRAEVETTVPLVQVGAEVGRRPRPSMVRPTEVDPLQVYISDAADAFELGREIGRAERDHPES